MNLVNATEGEQAVGTALNILTYPSYYRILYSMRDQLFYCNENKRSV